jgi:hypothetical protein
MKKDILIIDITSTDKIFKNDLCYNSNDYTEENIKEETDKYVIYYPLNTVAVVSTIEEAKKYIGCHKSALYKNMQLYGIMKANGFALELINVEA